MNILIALAIILTIAAFLYYVDLFVPSLNIKLVKEALIVLMVLVSIGVFK